MRYIVDQPLPAMLADVIREFGQDAIHPDALGEAADSDRAIWDIAARDRSVIVTKDQDFRRMLLTRSDDVRIVWVRLGNCSNRELFAHVRRVWPRVRLQLDEGRTLVEVR